MTCYDVYIFINFNLKSIYSNNTSHFHSTKFIVVALIEHNWHICVGIGASMLQTNYIRNPNFFEPLPLFVMKSRFMELYYL